MSLSLKDAQHIAELARIQVSDTELEQYRKQLGSILEYAARLSTVETSHISPTTTILPPQPFLREDEVRSSLDRESALANAPQIERDMFKIPPVFEK
jgi:aspartyl-tRNA(Asn)/glutamyl-tRNA(Gln) amidotransferase subunit C